MKVGDISIIIDYSILLFHKFNNFIMKNNFRSDFGFSIMQKNQAFVVQRHNFGDYKKILKDFSPSVHAFNYEEKKFILLLLGASLYGQNGINIWQAMCFFHRIPFSAMKSMGKILDPVNSLLKSGMVMFQETDFLGSTLSIEDIANFYNNRKVFLSPFALNSLFSNFTGKNLYGITNYNLSEKYKDIDSLLNDISSVMKYLFFLANFYKVNYGYSSIKEDIYVKGKFSKTLRLFKKNIIHSGLKILSLNLLRKMNYPM